jgi:GNAT superfamily N-acetyltransferase
MSEPVVRTYLALDDPDAIRPAPRPGLAGLEIVRVKPPRGDVNRWFYVRVGAPHNWIDNLHWSNAQWQSWADRVETWIALLADERAGYCELREDAGGVELAYFGLLREHHGQGLGGYLLTFALRRALEIAPRVWVHTNTEDGPAALPNYLARGLRPFKTEVLGAATAGSDR